MFGRECRSTPRASLRFGHRRRARGWLAIAAFIATLFGSGLATATPSYMSYFGLGWNIPEAQDHVNLYWTVSWRWDIAEVLDELRDAKRRGMRALVHTEFVFFDGSGTWANTCPYTLKPNLAARWDAFAQTLKTQGLLDTVAAFYPVDEPDLCGVSPGDVLTVLSVIRSHPLTAAKAVSAIFTCDIAKKYGGPYRYTGGHQYGDALRAYDWVGFDCYGSSNIFTDPAWTMPRFDVRCFCVRYVPGPSYYDNFKAQLDLARQRVMLVPQGFISAESDGFPDDPQLFATMAANDPAVVLMAPFTWFDQPFFPGVRSQPALALAWRNIGYSISSSNPPTGSLRTAVLPRLKVTATDVQHFSVYDLSCNATTNSPCSIELNWNLPSPSVWTQSFVRLNGGTPKLLGCGGTLASVDVSWIAAGNVYTFDLYQTQTCSPAVPAGAVPVASVSVSL
jgi:hypothetical protein